MPNSRVKFTVKTRRGLVIALSPIEKFADLVRDTKRGEVEALTADERHALDQAIAWIRQTCAKELHGRG